MESPGSPSHGLDARLARSMRLLGERFGEDAFTVVEAQWAGVSRGSLGRLAAAGALVKVARGLYVAARAERPWIDRLRALLDSRPELAACRVTAAHLTRVAIPPEPWDGRAVRERQADAGRAVVPGGAAKPPLSGSPGGAAKPPLSGSPGVRGLAGTTDLLHLCGIEGFDVPHWRVPGVKFARTSVPASQVVTETRSGLRVTDPIRTALDLACGRELACALVPLDSVLRLLVRSGLPPDVARSLVSDRCAAMRWHPGVRALRRAVGFMHAGAESALESMVRGRLIDAGIEGIRVQLLLDGASGREYRVDLAIEKAPGRFVIIEADGLGKYADSDDLVKEKRRQHDLESRGHGVVRAVYREAAYEPGALITRVRTALAQ